MACICILAIDKLTVHRAEIHVVVLAHDSLVKLLVILLLTK